MLIPIEFDEVRFVDLCIDPNGITDSNEHHYRAGYTRGKDAYLALHNEDVLNIFYNATHLTKASVADTLFISPLCKTPRDLIRKSGYKITINKDKATKVVVPQIYKPEYDTVRMASSSSCGDKKYLYLFSCRFNGYYNHDAFTDEERSLLKKEAENFIYNDTQDTHPTIYETDGFTSAKVYYLKRSAELRELFSVNKPNYYITELDLQFDPVYDITLENLDIWRRYDDITLLEKSLIGSNWQDYPLTVCTFLKAHKLFLRRTEPMRVLIDALEIDEFFYGSVKNWGENRVISPEDWNLCQEFVMMQKGVNPDTGGSLKSEKYFSESRRMDIDNLYAERIYVKPIFISEPAPFLSLMNMIQNI